MGIGVLERGKLNSLRKRRILWISFLFSDIALDRVARVEILEHLIRRGHHIALACVRPRNANQVRSSQTDRVSVPVGYVPVVSPAMFAITLFLFLPFYIIASKPDLVIVESNVPPLGIASTIPIAKLKRIKLFLDIRTPPVEIVGFRGFLQAISFVASVSTARSLFDGITIITPQMGKELSKRFKIDPKQVGVWSSGVSTTLFDPKSYASSSRKLKAKLGLARKFVVFYHGVFSANRGLSETIEAMSLVKCTCPDIAFLLLGSGPAVLSLRELVQKKEIEDKVMICDPVDQSEVPKYIGLSEVCIVPLPNHPYWRYQSPLKLLEYLSMEKVVIVTDIPAHRSVIGKERCGVYVPSINPIEIAESIVFTYHNRDKLDEWGKIGRTIVKKYTWEKVAEDLENCLLSSNERKSGVKFGKE